MKAFPALVAAIAVGLAGCAGAAGSASMAAPEHRWPTNTLDIRLCPSEDAAQSPYTACQRVREPFTVLRRSSRRDLLAYEVRTDAGKTGWIDGGDYIMASESNSEHASRQRHAAEAVKAKAECDRKGGVSIGMTRAQVYASCWGRPSRVNRTLNAYAEHEQFVYGGGNYVYLRNGVVTSIQTGH